MPYHVKTDPKTGRRDITLESETFLVRTATVEDVSERWAGWLNDPIATMMLNARPRNFTLEELREYVRSFDNITKFLACIFERKSGKHIGIATAELFDNGRKASPAVLIGEPDFRSMGMLREMEDVSYELYFDVFKVDAIVSFVLPHNQVAIAFNESRGWKYVTKHVGAKRSARTGELLDLLEYQFTRDMWEQKKAGQAKA